PKLDTVTWYDHKTNDRVYEATNKSLDAWHTVMIRVKDGVVAYWLGGKQLFTRSAKDARRPATSMTFTHGSIAQPDQDQQAWDMKVAWLYYNANETLSAEEVQTQVEDFTGRGMNYFDTVRGS